MQEYMRELYFDLPITYKELKIYPIKMKEYLEFHMLVDCLLIDKNSIPDVNIINMSYLRFLYYESAEKGLPYVFMLKALLCLVLHMDLEEEINFYINDKNQAFFKVRGVEYNSNDFNKIVNIIFEQNCIDAIDNTIQKEIRDALEKAQEYKIAQNHRKICSLEEQMICVLISTPLKFEDIYELTIRKFTKIIERVNLKMHYQIYLSASMSGLVKFKNDDAITYWMADLSKTDKYAEVKVDMDAMREKIEGINK